eukprot:TRINITY_DN26656_c0_g1_i1.p1 TRINITY_DN26656_c0_g1~~TRINITY_DN26656_c0_g1_i1.p1  ORF type:complete len:503 (+),score=81.16 TRINITY_DN26656_c0_g1_i1:28-1509(+)
MHKRIGCLVVFLSITFGLAQDCPNNSTDFSIIYSGDPVFTVTSTNHSCMCPSFVSSGTSLLDGISSNQATIAGMDVGSILATYQQLFSASGNAVQGAKTAVFNLAATGWTVVPGLSATIKTTGGPLLVFATSNMNAGAVNDAYQLNMKRNETLLSSATNGFQMTSHVAVSENSPFSMATIDQPPAGTYTYQAVAGKVTAAVTTGQMSEENDLSAVTVLELPSFRRYAVAYSAAQYVSTVQTPLKWMAIPGLSLTINTGGGPVLLLANVNYNVDSSVTAGPASFSYFRNDNNLGPDSCGLTLQDGGKSQSGVVNVYFIDTPPAGSHRYDYRIKQHAGTGQVNKGGAMTTLIAAVEMSRLFSNFANTSFTTITALTATVWTQIPGLAAKITTDGAKVLVLVNLNHNPTTSGAFSWTYFSIYRDGVNLGHPVMGFGATVAYYEVNKATPLVFLDSSPAGTYTYSVWFRVGGGSSALSECNLLTSMYAIEISSLVRA